MNDHGAARRVERCLSERGGKDKEREEHQRQGAQCVHIGTRFLDMQGVRWVGLGRCVPSLFPLIGEFA